MFTSVSTAQQITGVWKGKVDNKKVELKIIKSGDSLLGTSYYYDSRNHYRRYTIKGYFDPATNGVIWWDDQLIDARPAYNFSLPENALLSVADFNCPGENEMRLDGSVSLRDDKDMAKSPLNLQKINTPFFPDEWDFVIDNYTSGANDPRVIDSVNRLRYHPPVIAEEVAVNTPAPVELPRDPAPRIPVPEVKAGVPPAKETVLTNARPDDVENKFSQRKKVLQQVIPVTAKKIELKFYDNGIIDGDSIAIFLNDRLLYKNIRLALEPFTITLNASELQDDNELVMVAHNLGSIPPNTSLMVVELGDKTYEARLYANENSSALVRFVKNTAGADDGKRE